MRGVTTKGLIVLQWYKVSVLESERVYNTSAVMVHLVWTCTVCIHRCACIISIVLRKVIVFVISKNFSVLNIIGIRVLIL